MITFEQFVHSVEQVSEAKMPIEVRLAHFLLVQKHYYHFRYTSLDKWTSEEEDKNIKMMNWCRDVNLEEEALFVIQQFENKDKE